jgi:hypothetical protein
VQGYYMEFEFLQTPFLHFRNFFKRVYKLSLHRLEKRIVPNSTLNLASFSKCRDTRFQPKVAPPPVRMVLGDLQKFIFYILIYNIIKNNNILK